MRHNQRSIQPKSPPLLFFYFILFFCTWWREMLGEAHVSHVHFNDETRRRAKAWRLSKTLVERNTWPSSPFHPSLRRRFLFFLNELPEFCSFLFSTWNISMRFLKKTKLTFFFLFFALYISTIPKFQQFPYIFRMQYKRKLNSENFQSLIVFLFPFFTGLNSTYAKIWIQI